MDRALPTGTVTFRFTDVEGSTRLLHELGDRYADALAEHRRVVREAVARHGGVEVETQGDAFFFQVVEAASNVAALLAGCSRLVVLVTSREPFTSAASRSTRWSRWPSPPPSSSSASGPRPRGPTSRPTTASWVRSAAASKACRSRSSSPRRGCGR